MNKKFTKAKVAGFLIILGGFGHLLPSLLGTLKIWAKILRAGWWNNIPPPWSNAAMDLQKAFWIVWGSFALPFIILGALIIWLANRGIKIPRFAGVGLLVYAVITIALMPISGMWIFLISAVLLLADRTN